MPVHLNSANDLPIVWCIVIDHYAGRFLSRMGLTTPQIASANRSHVAKHDSIRVYDEAEAIRLFRNLVPIGLDDLD